MSAQQAGAAHPPEIGGLAGRWTGNYPMSKLCSWHAGGAAKWLYEPAGVDDLSRLLAGLGGEPALFVGRGTNLLVRDGGFDGVAVRCGDVLDWLRVREGNAVEAGAGVPCPKAAKFAADEGLRGGEFLCGIPGTVGGALAMNAGCHGSETWGVVRRVAVAGADGQVQELGPEDFRIGYRSVACRDGTQPLFVWAEFVLEPGDPGAIRSAMARMMGERRRTQPLRLPNSGSVFRNPPQDSAGRLIERCGLKGFSIGDAEISTMHANFIVNRGRASAADIERLIRHARDEVQAREGVELDLEVRIVGRETA